MQARGLGTEATIARRIDDLTRRVRDADDALRARADRLVRRLDAVQQVAANHGLLVEDLGISLAVRDGARFIAREGWTLLVGGPFALWGRVNHWLPFRAARLVAARSVESAADPAMRTLIAGVAFVSMSYLVQTLIVASGIRPTRRALLCRELTDRGRHQFLAERTPATHGAPRTRVPGAATRSGAARATGIGARDAPRGCDRLRTRSDEPCRRARAPTERSGEAGRVRPSPSATRRAVRPCEDL